ncbi:MAG: hypothetical protein WD055_05195 [Candidatus Dependentiae bacterium]
MHIFNQLKILIVLLLSAANVTATTYPYFDFNLEFDNEKTAVCFLNGATDFYSWNTPVKQEFIKLIIHKAPHIFITPDILQEFITLRNKYLKELTSIGIDNPREVCSVRNGKLYVSDKPVNLENEQLETYLTELFAFNPNEWHIYDTRLNLYYLQHNFAPDIGIRVDSFSYIDDLNDYSYDNSMPRVFRHSNDSEYSTDWINNFNELFDIEKWHSYKDKTNKQPIIFIGGHGLEKNLICGMQTNQFKNIFTYIDSYLNAEYLAITSCFWPAQRITELMNETDSPWKFNLGLLTPIDNDAETYTYTRPFLTTYDPITQTCAFEQKGRVMTIFEGAFAFADACKEFISHQWNKISI